MKFIYITCNVSMLEQITSLIRETECENFQVIEQVFSNSSYDEPRQNNGVWPGYNSSILIQEEDTQKAYSLLESINRLNINAFNNGELIAAYIWDIEKGLSVKPIKPLKLKMKKTNKLNHKNSSR